MCRRQWLGGCCLMAMGLGVMMGYCIERWFWCACIGVGMMVLGFCMLKRR